ncbi:hypothetical protein PB1_12959 [Bacillus methanolicus PB1]|uniref:TsaA-like domain-containing protein n=1 Tax=Bacillus methanolicus PB1 TaxID=997296 RepID=I3DW47_BACMT|nr:SAM-dependent methyltransferase [Bacillus methanolicus]EIJ78468.1 hypothetical protein PB1_12959 [Bacillus methanolicus PB1]
MIEQILLTPIGKVISGRIDIKDDYWGSEVATIELDSSQFTEEVLDGLEEFSHVDILYHFHLLDSSKIQKGARHPRNKQEYPKVGIFSQRRKNRPNRIGVSTCKLLRVDGLKITVQALDAIEGTPIIDIKPYMQEFGPREIVKQPNWSKELMKEYFL